MEVQPGFLENRDSSYRFVKTDRFDSPATEKTSHVALLTFDRLYQLSEEFAQRHPYPTQANLIKNLAPSPETKRQIEDMAKSTSPILDQSAISLITHFLEVKKSSGSHVEKKLYSDMTVDAFIDRMLKKRPLAFLNRDDSYLLRDGTTGQGGFELIGTDQEKPPLSLEEYLSYDEMQISALIGLAVPTKFINNGWRNNRGIPAKASEFIDSGIYYGLVGARLEKPGVMEWKHVVITPEQNTPQNGYGRGGQRQEVSQKLLDVWAKFYGISHFPTFQEAQADSLNKYLKIKGNLYLNTHLYKERIRKTIEPFLLDANERAKAAGKKAYVHAVGIGLGAWLLTPEQGRFMVEVYKQVVSKRSLEHIADIDFSWFPKGSETALVDVPEETLHGIKLHFSKRNPASTLRPEDKEKLLISSYAWDSNSYPGNEYWLGSECLALSGDPAAACCSLIVELQNPEINPAVSALFTRFYKTDV